MSLKTLRRFETICWAGVAGLSILVASNLHLGDYVSFTRNELHEVLPSSSGGGFHPVDDGSSPMGIESNAPVEIMPVENSASLEDSVTIQEL